MGKATKSKHYIIAGVLRMMLPCVRIVPRPLLFKIGTFCGCTIYALSRRERTKIETHLSIGLPDFDAAKRRALGRACLSHFCCMLLDVLRLRKKDIPQMFHDGALEKTKQLFAQHHGAIAITPHLGNWELGGAALSYILNGATRPIAKKIKMTPFQNIVQDIRYKLGVNPFYQEEDMRSFAQFLTQGGVLGILPDQDIPRMNGVFVSFLGKRAFTPTGPVQLAAITGVPIIPMACIYRDGKYDVLTSEPFHVDRRARKDGRIEEYTQMWSDAVSSFIRQYPEQWVWMHRRWRTQEM